MDTKDYPENGIAIIGMSGKFPGSDSIHDFWNHLCHGTELISSFSEEDLRAAHVPENQIRSQNYVKARGIIRDIELFDADFFGMSAAEVQITDPQHRLFLECAWEALEDAGYPPENYSGSIGVYGGMSMSTYYLNLIHSNQQLKDKIGDYLIHIGNEKDYLTTRVSYKLNLKGPSLAIQTACSTSLVAVCIACNHLLTYQCDMALAGGISLSLPQQQGYVYQEGFIFSPDGHCRPFDASAVGTVPGNGAGIVLLKRLDEAIQDRDHIYAVIRGYGINNDGHEKIGFASPSMQGQSKVIDEALMMSEINPDTISFVEAHGTGTIIGDPIEIDALIRAYRKFTDKKSYCAIGSVKSNIGHLMDAAGIAGLIKATLGLHYRTVPPTLNFDTPNPHINFVSSPFFVNTAQHKLEDRSIPHRAGVSSFGIGSTNAHVILEEAPKPLHTQKNPRQCELLIFSARTNFALRTMVENYERFVDLNSILSLSDIAYTLRVGRKAFEHREFFICKNLQEATSLNLHSRLESINMKMPSIVFLMGDEHVHGIHIRSELYQTEPCYRQAVDKCSHFLASRYNIYLDKSVNAKDAALHSDCRVFVGEYALSILWREWGVIPQSIIGYGCSEYLAAYLANVFSLENALSLVVMRNSHAMQEELKQHVNQIQLKRPAHPFYSNVTGEWITDEEALSPNYWVQHIEKMSNDPSKVPTLHITDQCFIQITPGINLCKRVEGTSRTDFKYLFLSSLPEEKSSSSDYEVLLDALGNLWKSGFDVDWKGFDKHGQNYRISLPTYPFEKKRYWIDPPTNEVEIHSEEKRTQPLPKNTSNSIEAMLIAVFKEQLGVESLTVEDDFFTLGGDSITAIQIISQINNSFGISLKWQMMMEKPTILLLSQAVQQLLDSQKQDHHPKYTDLVILRSGNETSPLFVIHPIGGHVFCYKPLAEALNYPGPIYGIEATDGINEESIEGMAARYIQEIRLQQPEGPYFLLGASFGGAVAYEIASQLIQSQQSLGMLSMMDIIRPDALPRQKNDDLAMLSTLINLFEGRSIPYEDLKNLTSEDQTSQLMNSMGLQTLSSAEQQKIFMLVKKHWKALMIYKPKPIREKIVFFQARDRATDIQSISLSSTWSDLAMGGMDVYETSGNHMSMIFQPHVSEVAQILNNYFKH